MSYSLHYRLGSILDGTAKKLAHLEFILVRARTSCDDDPRRHSFGDKMEYKDFCWFLASLIWSFTGGLIIGVIRFVCRPIESIWARNGVDSD